MSRNKIRLKEQARREKIEKLLRASNVSSKEEI